MTTATKVPSEAVLAPPVKAAGRVASAPLRPVLAPVVLEMPADAGADLKVEVPLPALYGRVAIVGSALEWPGLETLGFGDMSVTGAADDFGGAGAEAV